MTQTTPGPTSVTVTVSRPDATHLTVTADAPSVFEDACVLGLGGTFNAQVVLTPTPAVATGSSFIVLQTTDASSGGPINGGVWSVPNYDAVYPSSPDTFGPLSAMGISATYTDAWCNEPDDGSTVGFGTAVKPPGYGYVSYSIPFGSGPPGPTGPYNKVKFLCTQPFGYDFLAPCSVTVVPAPVGCPQPGEDRDAKSQRHQELCEEKAGHEEHENGHDEQGTEQAEQNQQNTDHSGEDLNTADLKGYDFSNANLQGADLSASDLTGANLAGANLSCANLSFANLSGANLLGAIIEGADLTGANLQGVDLSGVITSGPLACH